MLVLALDPPFGLKGDKSTREIIEETKHVVSAYKIGLPLVLKEGVGVIREVKESSGRRVIVDFKLAEIGDVMKETISILARNGADAVIVHGFIGVEGALDVLVEESRKLGLDVIIVVSMTHKGATRFLDIHFEELLKQVVDLNVHGVVLPATRLHLIKKARGVLGGSIKIYSPGIGVQGAEPGSAICAGADYEIIGRLITRSENPRVVAERVYSAQLEAWRRCRGYQ